MTTLHSEVCRTVGCIYIKAGLLTNKLVAFLYKKQCQQIKKTLMARESRSGLSFLLDVFPNSSSNMGDEKG